MAASTGVIYCNNSKPYLFNIGYNVINISVPDGKLTITGPVVRDYYNNDNGSRNSTATRDITRALNEYFNVSFIENKFYSIGCDNLATINGFCNGSSKSRLHGSEEVSRGDSVDVLIMRWDGLDHELDLGR
ncbi:hypothetical protein G4B88_005571 [Cannabis sativa]|uniref:Uncharacterized protein n=1 Tax=Cannabis sativa TaxID=3483 RepID=A0A7J6H999_CANSA|nr:hypothetical protein G4B88_005571 [Cannabis sativa]